jgi:CheY-like chemotaxis protein/anti-sigma regulatory factor (Ser/Thr protein kinase)
MQPAPAPAQRILIVDDEESIRDLLIDVLTAKGYRIEIARNGGEAWKRLQSESFDLVLLDVWMPEMNGLELLHQMKRTGIAPRVIVMTADQTPETVLESVRKDAFHFINKPFAPDAIVELVQKSLRPQKLDRIEVLSAKPQWVELLVPCSREVVDRIESFLMAMKGDLSQDVRESIGAAFHELLLNAMEWGGKFDSTRHVRIAYLRTSKMILYRIADPGEGFRFEGLTHAAISYPPDNPTGHLEARDEKGLRVGGFGILLARQLVDELLYNEAQNEVVLIKYL